MFNFYRISFSALKKVQMVVISLCQIHTTQQKNSPSKIFHPPNLLMLFGKSFSSDGVTIKISYGVDVILQWSRFESLDQLRLTWYCLVVDVTNVDSYPLSGFPRPDLSHWGYRNRCLMVAQCHLVVKRTYLKEATKRLLHQQVKYQGSVSAHVSVSLQLLPVLFIFQRSLVISCYNR